MRQFGTPDNCGLTLHLGEYSTQGSATADGEHLCRHLRTFTKKLERYVI
jgi:hypothetical protein